MVHQLGSRKLNTLIDTFETARNIFNAPIEELERHLTPKGLCTITSQRNLQYIEGLLNSMEAEGIVYYSREHERYPNLLKEIPDPPVGLFCIGTFPPESMHKVAIIGSRRCSEYGLMAAQLLATPLAQNGVVVVSGMARGVDSMAHKGAIQGGGQTVAVLGCGVDVCYPPENNFLRKEIINNGCVISEYPPSTQPLPAFFPARNRIISGLSKGVVVTEAAAKSGTLITVDQAASQGREVMAVPGNISSRLSEGTNHLIRDGAHIVASHIDILYALGISKCNNSSEFEKKQPKDQKNNETDSLSKNLATEEKQVYDSLSYEPVSFDILSEMVNIGVGQLHLICTSLELKGLLKKLPGSRYIKNIVN